MMKLSSTLSMLMLSILFATNIFSTQNSTSQNSPDIENFYKKYKQSSNAKGSPKDYIVFLNTGKCINGNLQDFDLTEAIEKLNKDGKQIALYHTNCRGANFSNVNMSSAELSYGNFTDTIFQNSNLENVRAWSTNFGGSFMDNIQMCNAKLYFADFGNATLQNINLNGAKVNIRTCFRNTYFKSADLRNIDDLDKADFCRAELRKCKMDLSHKINTFLHLHSPALMKGFMTGFTTGVTGLMIGLFLAQSGS